MVIDSSALIALLLDEAESTEFVGSIANSTTRLISAASYLETAIVLLNRLGPSAPEIVDKLLAELSIDIFPFTQEQAALAMAAYGRFGRGTGHPAGLNFGDCFTYALAKLTGEPVLFKGDDFSRTDLISAVAVP
jgi:ribonuclease VapC